MLKKSYYLILFMLLPLNVYTKELIKSAKYDFQELIIKMAEEPKLRSQFSDALRERVFLPLMLNSHLDTLQEPTNKLDWNNKIKAYTHLFITKSLLKEQQKLSESSQKSSSIKKSVILGLTLANQYRGFSIILKPDEKIFYADTDLAKNIANTIANYDDTKKQALEEEKLIDEEKTGEQ